MTPRPFFLRTVRYSTVYAVLAVATCATWYGFFVAAGWL